jgi:hypothetical protein
MMLGKEKTRKTNSSSKNWFFSLTMLSLIAVFVTYVLIWIVDENGKKAVDPNLGFPLILIFGVIDFLVFLTLTSHILNYLGLSCKEEALGLPAGSVRALIALSLIVIFAIMAIFMQMQLSAAPLKDINGNYLMDANGQVIYNQPSQDKKDFALQTLTTISTLVVAVAGFYFGTRAVEAAKGEITKKVTLTTDPKNFIRIKSGEPLAIQVSTNPENQGLDWLVEGDIPKSLVHEKLNEFKYTPSKKPDRTQEAVTLTFIVANIRNVQEKLIVLVEDPTEKDQDKSK